MPLKPHPTDPDKMVYVKREYIPPKEWVGLTDEEIMSLLPGAVRLPPGWLDTVRAIETRLKEKNT